jgi:hypothetical protein
VTTLTNGAGAGPGGEEFPMPERTTRHEQFVAETPGATRADGRPAIYGAVRRGDGEPVATATVTLTDIAGRQIDLAHTGTDGCYRLVPTAGGTYLVIGAAGGHQPTVAHIAVADGPVRCDLTLARGGSLAGTVRLRGCEPAPVASATVTVADATGAVVAVARTDDTGRYRVADLATGTYTVVVAAEPYPPAAATIEIGSARTAVHDVDLVATGSIAGIVAGEDYVPFENAAVTVLDPRDRVVATTVTGADGEFEFPALPPGDYTVVAHGYGPAATSISIRDGATAGADLTLRMPAASQGARR